MSKWKRIHENKPITIGYHSFCICSLMLSLSRLEAVLARILQDNLSRHNCERGHSSSGNRCIARKRIFNLSTHVETDIKMKTFS